MPDPYAFIYNVLEGTDERAPILNWGHFRPFSSLYFRRDVLTESDVNRLMRLARANTRRLDKYNRWALNKHVEQVRDPVQKAYWQQLIDAL